MKMNTIVNESMTDEYKELFGRFITDARTEYGRLTLDNDGIINYDHSTSTMLFSGSFRKFLDDTGTSILKFGKFNSSVRIICDNLKSLKNMPNHVTRECYMSNLNNIDDFDLDFEHCHMLRISQCGFKDLTNIKNVFNGIVLANLPNITSFNDLPEVTRNDVYLSLVSLNIDSDITTANDNIYRLNMTNVQKFKNFTNLPKNIKILRCGDLKDFTSFRGIDEYKNLTDFVANVTAIDNIIILLLCPQITNNFELDDYVFINSNGTVANIINSFMEMVGSKRSDHIMDCAVYLIDAGFPEAAEL